MFRCTSFCTKIYLFSAFLRYLLAICPNTSNYPYSVFLDKEHHYEFTWRVDYVKELVHFRVCFDTFSALVFGVGFSNYGEMENSDFVVYWTSDSGIHHFQVRYIFTLNIFKIYFSLLNIWNHINLLVLRPRESMFCTSFYFLIFNHNTVYKNYIRSISM